jgi:hypothetical protein
VNESSPESSPDSGPQDDPIAAADLVDMRSEFGIADLVLEPTVETGSHPMLSWQAAAGATSYWLVVRDADDRPYWAWTGAEVSVRFGGGDTEEPNQTAVLHEMMTWRVAAFDAEGSLIALSESAVLSP